MKPSAPLRLPDTVASAQDLSGLIMELHECVKWLSHESVKKSNGATETSAAPTTSPAAATLIHEYGASKEKLEALINALEDLQHSAKIVTITLAAQPSNSIKATLVGWCRQELAADVLVNFGFNRSLLGGMVVRAGSRVFDWSFRRQILDASDKFPEVLRRV
jgi:F0F1-type ATP synthase delta subunit